MSSLVSIIMPAYNVECYIRESIHSIQKQTFTEWELIVVNDGSGDKTPQIVTELAQADARIRLINQKNGGVSNARNKGLSEACCDYIAFLDGDDLWEPSFLAELMQAINSKPDSDMAYCGYNHFYGGVSRPYRYQYCEGDILLHVIKGTVRLHIGAMLIRKRFLDDNNFCFTESLAIGEDQEFIGKIVASTTVAAVPKNLMQYRVRPGSAITSHWDWKKHAHAIVAHKNLIQFIHGKSKLSDNGELLCALTESLGNKLYRFLWRMVKMGYHQEALELLESDTYKYDLSNIRLDRLGFIGRLKYKVVMSKNRVLWGLAKLMKL